MTFGYAVLVYLKEAIAKDGLIGSSSQEYKLEIDPGDSFGLNPVARQACVHPVLDLWHSELRQYFKDKGPLQCAEDENWVYVQNGTFRISERARQKHGEIHCEYTPQLRGEYTPYTLQLRGEYTLQLRGEYTLQPRGEYTLQLRGEYTPKLRGEYPCNSEVSTLHNSGVRTPHNSEVSTPHNSEVSTPHNSRVSTPHNSEVSTPHIPQFLGRNTL